MMIIEKKWNWEKMYGKMREISGGILELYNSKDSLAIFRIQTKKIEKWKFETM